MKTILVTGSDGFMGRNLCVALRREPGFEVLEFDLPQTPEDLAKLAARADLVFHLAGVNRPKDEQEFTAGNADLTRQLCESLGQSSRRVPIVLSSSTQAELDNPYGRSKLAAEHALLDYQRRTGAPVFIYRFPNVFGKWSRPNYNTVVATFCHNIARGLPVQISNPANVIRFAYIDDIVREFLAIARTENVESRKLKVEIGKAEADPSSSSSPISGFNFSPCYTITLGELHTLLVSFRDARAKSVVPDLSDPLTKYLYSTYLSFYDTQDFARPVDLKTDDRGWLFELIKSPHAGQIFVSRTRPGITRGNHYHDTKIEKFCVIQGEGLIRFRHVLGSDILEYRVNDREIRVVDIPPGYTHSIENTGPSDMLTLFWANEIFDPAHPDTWFEKVATA
jgi:UDP-2-acetamido-2,6-beta-L-arabino-hexul-4-ose reductase